MTEHYETSPDQKVTEDRSAVSAVDWFRLDNAAKIYPPARSRYWAPMFRLSADLSEEIDTDLLKTALDHTLARLPSFSCRLRKGFFWYYLERIEGAPAILPDVNNPMTYFNAKDNKHFLFRIRCCGNRLALEFFHAVTDGSGGMTFLLTLISEYVRLRYHETIPTSGHVLSCSDPPKAEEYEDSFLKYARKETLSRGERPAYQPQGAEMSPFEVSYIYGNVPTEALLREARKHNATVGEFVTAVLIQIAAGLQTAERSRTKRRLPVKVSVPVNLRRFYPTKTLRNFSSYINLGIETRLGSYSFDEILVQVKSAMKSQITEKQLNARFSGNVATERILPLRATPLFIKDPLLKLFYNMQGDRYSSLSFSNLGRVDAPEQLQRYVKQLDFALGPANRKRCACTCVSFAGNTRFVFTRTFEGAQIEREFFCSLVKRGIPVKVESNRR
ncbi:MAG: hypothetical protein IJJ99_04480 [Oscillospiraceae bacterium]|nr:hypothetical protein [Oscillospiraceae bacterium]